MTVEKLCYLAIQNRLMPDESLGLTLVDWFTRQSIDSESGQAFHCPGLLVEFLPTQWNQASEKVQQCLFSFRTHLVQDRVTDRRSDDPNQAQNLAYLDKVQRLYQLLSGFRYQFTVADKPYHDMNSLRRIAHTEDHSPGKRIVSTTTWQAFVRDFSAMKQFQRMQLEPVVDGTYLKTEKVGGGFVYVLPFVLGS